MTSSATSAPTSVTPVTTTALYWYGALPAIGEVDIKIPQNEYNETVGGYYSYGKTTAKKAWNGHSVQMWLGKCPEYQSLPAGGLIFHAFSERMVRQGDSPEFGRFPWPGSVIKLTSDRYKQVVHGATRQIYRVDEASGKGKLLYLDIGKHPDIDPNDPNTRPMVTEFISFDPRTDKTVAEFVYLRKILDLGPGVNEPKADKYPELIPTRTMDDFFENPPPSIADDLKAVKKG